MLYFRYLTCTDDEISQVICHEYELRVIHTHPFNGPFSWTNQVSRYQKGKTSLDFTEARDNDWQWHQLGHMQVCTSLQTDNHASTPSLSFLQAGCPSCRPANSVKALDERKLRVTTEYIQLLTSGKAIVQHRCNFLVSVYCQVVQKQ